MDHIAVIIPVYNITSFLEEAVKSATTQHYSAKEIIMIDDGSSQEAAQEIKRVSELYSVPLLHHTTNRGPAAARNTGLAHTNADLILFFDADDILLPDTLQYFANAMHENPSVVASYARIKVIDETGAFAPFPLLPKAEYMASGSKALLLLLERKLRFYNGAVCIRRQALEKLPLDNTHLRVGEDWLLWCHLALSGEIIPAGDKVVLHRRKHASSVSGNFISDPDTIFAPFNAIYSNPLFINAIGEKKMNQIREKFFGICNFYLANQSAAHSDREKALLFFQSINTPLSVLLDNMFD